MEGGREVERSCMLAAHRYRPAWEQAEESFPEHLLLFVSPLSCPPPFLSLHVPSDSDRKQTCVAETKARYRDKSIGQGPKATADLYFYPDRLEKCQRSCKALRGTTARAIGGGYKEEGFNKEERDQKNEGNGIRKRELRASLGEETYWYTAKQKH